MFLFFRDSQPQLEAMDSVYELSSTERVQQLEKDLAGKLGELKDELEEQGALPRTTNWTFSSVQIPKDVAHFRREREVALKRTLGVAECKPLVIQADVLQRELESCLRREYTPENLPLLLLQKQVGYIMQEFNDAVQRAERLAVARENFLMGKSNPPHLVTPEDLTIYTRWLVCHLHSLGTIHHYLQVLQYVPISRALQSPADNQVSELSEEKEKEKVCVADLNSESPGPMDASISGHREDGKSENRQRWGWAHANVDRFAVLYDLWTWEANLLESKRQLLDSYLEAYQHTLDPEEGFTLAQAMTDIIHRRPKFDLGHSYFTKAYQDDCACLRLHRQLVRSVLSHLLEQQREYVRRLWRGDHPEAHKTFGLPPNIICKQFVSINNSCPASENVHLLELHPSLGLVGLIPKALEHLFREARHSHKPSSPSGLAQLEQRLLQLALDLWLTPAKPEAWYSAQLQRDVGAFCQDIWVLGKEHFLPDGSA
ncbi:Transmembrane protein FLJ37396 [Cricetulus griseus]|uniref:Transmembrane protein FLJ37396 n=1 Tax=Cricetulus griseus TaxID=10029 RepID=G3GXL2_CRIGR|nr:Transmembrane protein FLJ37396 [Cricetulus griseus]